MILALAAPAWAQHDVAPTPSEQAALQQLEHDPRLQAMLEGLAELERLENEPQNQRAIAAWHGSMSEAILRHLRSVALQGDARGLMAAALLWPEPTVSDPQPGSAQVSPERRAWFDAALRTQPRDTLVAWVQASSCGGLGDRCDRQGALQFLLQADPGNAAVQLLAFAHAEAAGDAKAADRYWAAAAAAHSYNPRMLEMGKLLHATLGGMALPRLDARVGPLLGRSLGLGRAATAEDLREVHAMSVWSAQALPAFQPITRRCAAASPLDETQVRCERIMALLAADQSNLIAPMIGLRKMVELAAGRADSVVWRERLRQFYWVYENAQRSLGQGAHTVPANYLGRVLQEGELPAMRQLLEENGIPSVPPQEWLPEPPSIRALVGSIAAQDEPQAD